MTVSIHDDRDVRMAWFIAHTDPFQLAPPFWLRSPLASLPPETINTLSKEFNHMAIRLIKEQEVPARLNNRGTLNQTNEYREVMEAFRTLPAGQAIVVSLDDPAFKTMTKTIEGKVKNNAANAFASAMRRYFAAKQVNATAYQSGAMEVTIRRQAPAPKRK